MLRSMLLAAVFAGHAAAAQETLIIPEVAPDDTPALPPCEHIEGDTNSCARTLACIGKDGLWFDGQARGWDQGILIGTRSDGVSCTGTWKYGGLINTARARLVCDDGLSAWAIYTQQDQATSTGVAYGMDNKGRRVRAWTGTNVLQFLGESSDRPALLPCNDTPIPIS